MSDLTTIFFIGFSVLVIIGLVLLKFPTKYQKLHEKEDDWIDDKPPTKTEKFKIKILKNIYFILLPFIFFIGIILSEFLTVDKNFLLVLVTASSFIVAVISGFLINSYYNVKQLRWEKLERFSELQNRLRDYTNAFYFFWSDVSRQHQLDYRYPESIYTLEYDSDWNYYNDESIPIRFVRYLREFSGIPSEIPDFELSQQIINEKKLEEMHHCIQGAGGLLSRYKHFKYILKVFHLKDTNDLYDVIIVDSKLVESQARKITKQGENYKTLGFWEDKIGEAEELLARMMSNGKFVYSFNIFEIQRLGLNLLFISIFGILLPISILMFNSSIENYKPFLVILSGIGFMTYFCLGILRIYRKLSSTQLSYS